jgi:hypothetical protein
VEPGKVVADHRAPTRRNLIREERIMAKGGREKIEAGIVG